MKNSFYRILLICLILMLMLGCQTEYAPENSLPETQGSSESLEAPTTMEASLETDLLTIESWDTQRTQESSKYHIAETESGFYMQCAGITCYADKTDPSNWVVLCRRPQCDHILSSDSEGERDFCDAYIYNQIILNEERLYFITNKNMNPPMWGQDPDYLVPEVIVGSLALDGSDARSAYTFPVPEFINRYYMTLVNGAHGLYAHAVLNEEGTYDTLILGVDKNGGFEIYSGQQSEDYVSFNHTGIVCESEDGSTLFTCNILDPSLENLYQIVDRQLVEYDFQGVSYDSGHLKDNILTLFRSKEGYFRRNMATGEEVKLADPQLEHSTATVLYPNCILESTFVGYTSTQFRSDLEQHQMRFFDGQTWRDVAIPEEIQSIPDTKYLQCKGVTSDRILFLHQDFSTETGNLTVTIYQLLLGTENPALERLGDIPIG